MTSTTKPGTSRARLRGLDGLRAIAVIAVIAYHFAPDTVIGGYLGVDIFFVISGFLITGLLVRERATTARVNVPKFWLRRVRRLVPALAVMVVLTSAAAFVLALVLGAHDLLIGLGTQVLGATTFSSNWLFIAEGASYFDASTPHLLQNLWSLAVEEQFYLVWPLLTLALVLVPWRWVRASVALLIAVASALAMALLAVPDGDPTRVYYGTDTHSFGLALGAAIAFLLDGRFGEDAPAPARRAVRVALPLVGLLAIASLVALALVLPERSPLTTSGGLALVAVLTALAIVSATTPRSWLGVALDLQPLRWIGERSYGLYLWHWPVLVLFAAAVPAGAPWWIVPAAALVTTVALAAWSYWFIETPVRTLGFRGFVRARWSGRVVMRVTSLATAVLLLAAAELGALGILNDPGKGQVEQQVQSGIDAIAQPGYAVAPRRPQPLPTGDQIYAIGDSVMLAAAPELKKAFPGIAIDAVVSRQMWQAEDIVGDLVQKGPTRPIVVVGLGTNGYIDEDSLETMHDLLEPDAQLIVVNVQVPRDWMGEVNDTLSEFARRERDVELSNWHDAIHPYIDTLAPDEVHPGPTGARIYAEALAAALQRLADLPPLLSGNDYQHLNRPL